VKRTLKSDVSILNQTVTPVFVEVLVGSFDYKGEMLDIEICRSSAELEPCLTLPSSVKKGAWKFWLGFTVWHVALVIIIGTWNIF